MKPKTLTPKINILISLLLIFIPFQSQSSVLEGYLPEKPIKIKAPDFPRHASRHAQEGWVELDYIINESGSVIEPIVIDSVGIEGRIFEKEALKSALKFKYIPASINGTPIESGHHERRFIFLLERIGDSGVGIAFLNRYKKISVLLDSNQLDKADAELKALIKNKHANNLYEQTWFWWMNSVYYLKKNNIELAHVSLNRTLKYEAEYLTEEFHQDALLQLYQVQIKRMLFSDAFDTLKIINKTSTNKDQLEALNNHAKKIREVLATNPPIESFGKIIHHNVLKRKLNYRTFSLAETQNSANKFEVRCDRKRLTSDYITTQTWTIPESWGDDCKIYFFGDDGSSFKMTETVK